MKMGSAKRAASGVAASGFAAAGRMSSMVSSRVYGRSGDPRLQAQLKEALSNQNWGCSNSVLYEIAAQSDHQLPTIMEAITQALSERDRNWRRVFKALNLIEAILKHGDLHFVEVMRSEQWRVMRYSDWRYQEGGKDVGAGIREKARKVLELVSDQEYLAREREEARQIAAKLTQAYPAGQPGGPGGSSDLTGNSQAMSSTAPSQLVERTERVTHFSTTTGCTYFEAKRILSQHNYDVDAALAVYNAEKRKRDAARGADFSAGAYPVGPPPREQARKPDLSTGPSAEEHRQRVTRVAQICACTHEKAANLLSAANNDVEAACNQFFAELGGDGGGQHSASKTSHPARSGDPPFVTTTGGGGDSEGESEGSEDHSVSSPGSSPRRASPRGSAPQTSGFPGIQQAPQMAQHQQFNSATPAPPVVQVPVRSMPNYSNYASAQQQLHRPVSQQGGVPTGSGNNFPAQTTMGHGHQQAIGPAYPQRSQPSNNTLMGHAGFGLGNSGESNSNPNYMQEHGAGSGGHDFDVGTRLIGNMPRPGIGNLPTGDGAGSHQMAQGYLQPHSHPSPPQTSNIFSTSPGSGHLQPNLTVQPHMQDHLQGHYSSSVSGLLNPPQGIGLSAFPSRPLTAPGSWPVTASTTFGAAGLPNANVVTGATHLVTPLTSEQHQSSIGHLGQQQRRLEYDPACPSKLGMFSGDDPSLRQTPGVSNPLLQAGAPGLPASAGLLLPQSSSANALHDSRALQLVSANAYQMNLACLQQQQKYQEQVAALLLTPRFAQSAPSGLAGGTWPRLGQHPLWPPATTEIGRSTPLNGLPFSSANNYSSPLTPTPAIGLSPRWEQRGSELQLALQAEALQPGASRRNPYAEKRPSPFISKINRNQSPFLLEPRLSTADNLKNPFRTETGHGVGVLDGQEAPAAAPQQIFPTTTTPRLRTSWPMKPPSNPGANPFAMYSPYRRSVNSP
ncbi:unnamed protein product [Amoebophrya sp. A25]|nr:unnamed protein product [Amoebophrya sp. A25]|eukprot:GSA25T00020219001.1